MADEPEVSGTAPAPEPVQTIASTPLPPAADTEQTQDAPPADAKPVGDWPEDWRTRLAGEDKGFLNKLARYATPQELAKAYRAIEQKQASGELKKGKPENATPEEIATWRKEAGLPATPEEYKIELPNGLVLGEADKPLVASFLKEAALEGDLSNAQVNKALGWYYANQDKQKAAQADADREYKTKAEDALRGDWGQEYRVNLTAVNNMLSAHFPEGAVDRFLAGRTADGRRTGDDPDILRGLTALARELNPAASLIPAGTTDPGKGIDTELEEIRELRRNDPGKYDADRKMQDRELQLIEARQKLKSRAA
jgi:hypothetical protein